jgi:hypothetical protein
MKKQLLPEEIRIKNEIYRYYHDKKKEIFSHIIKTKTIVVLQPKTVIVLVQPVCKAKKTAVH